jgi:hypothetical protein
VLELIGDLLSHSLRSAIDLQFVLGTLFGVLLVLFVHLLVNRQKRTGKARQRFLMARDAGYIQR